MQCWVQAPLVSVVLVWLLVSCQMPSDESSLEPLVTTPSMSESALVTPPASLETGAPPHESLSESALATPPASLETRAPPHDSPTIRFIHDHQLLEVSGGEQRHLGDLSTGLGAVLAAAPMEDEVLVLHGSGLQRLTQDGSQEILFQWDRPARFGELGLTGRGMQLVYSAFRDDLQAPGGVSTEVGLYDAQGGVVRSVFTTAQAMRALGVTADGDAIYLLHVGQDPSFGRVSTVSLERGVIESDLSISGNEFIALSPDSRYVVTTAGNTINLYDLAAGSDTPEMISLPEEGSFARGLFWLPDSERLLFMLYEAGHDLYVEVTPSLGLWQFDVQERRLAQAATPEALGGQLMHISPDGLWLLTRPSLSRDEALLVHRLDLRSYGITLPIEATIVGWP
jgi:hypothetical protein